MAEQKLPKLLTSAVFRLPMSKTQHGTRVWNQTLGFRAQNKLALAPLAESERLTTRLERAMDDTAYSPALPSVKVVDDGRGIETHTPMRKLRPDESFAYVLGVQHGVEAASARREAQAYNPRPQPARGTIYFIGSDDGPIKIGISQNAAVRLKTINLANPRLMRFLATVEGPVKLERDYHKRFKEHRLHGEWFSPHPDILAEIARLNEQEGV